MTARRSAHRRTRRTRRHNPRGLRIDGLGWIILGGLAVIVVFLVLM